ncbi:Sterol 3-beta-glucosyltransferase UGT80B1 [Colletotrichum aenigma]|uniref:Sterol 3-beta-glucosyltransferase UGT80B1 n=1 Tax=Colletotrichum aenigma TaxID=1215731 RepID=UPI0018725215|nr:Sterol 3-beta-glucosyltransferase UGT80B1 [Colletotrichum aenigma]KAF5518137.1 Sterol 3-beta-glucosyltransferase UGT80B1 [Colletotrichum aenigma]
MSKRNTVQMLEDDTVPQDYLPSYETAMAESMRQQRNSVNSDGRIDVNLDSRLATTLACFVPDFKDPSIAAATAAQGPPPEYVEAAARFADKKNFPVKLNIVIQVVGSRGDVQPFIALGNELQTYGHRVRLATHDVFDSFVRKSNLEFYPIGGDPSELMAYMVKNPGLIPSLKSLKGGDIQKKRKMVKEMLEGCWKSCIEPDTLTGRPFVADAIIANPPSFAHVHCAQALSVPLHLMFTMPWSSTRAFPHPLANLRFGEKGVVDQSTANFVSYSIVEWLTWQGLGDVINEWRKTIDLEEVPFSEGPVLAEVQKIPFTYCWSPALVPKPQDWPAYIDVCGFFFREPPQYTPPPDLAEFLAKGPTPIYIGFGSIVIDHPEEMTKTLVEAVRATGVRAIISKGWSNLGGIEADDVFFLGDCPHEWLFANVAAVFHHGGAGTTACGLLNGRPTTIVPFFGDQPFWGDMVAIAGAGPKPIPHKQLNAENLSEAIRFCLTPEALAAAGELAAKMRTENGVATAVKSFHANLPLEDLPCDIFPDQPATWEYKRGKKHVKLSKKAAGILLDHLKIGQKNMSPHDTRSIIIENRRWDPVTGASSALLGAATGMFKGATDIVVKPVQTYHERSKMKSAEMEDAISSGSQTPTRSASASLAPPSSEALERPRSAGPGSSSGSTGASGSTTGAVLKASASGVGGFFKAYGKFYLDVPLAVTDGLRNVPKLYGEKVEQRKPINDWKSGTIEGGKHFVVGLSEGFADLFVQPYKGGRDGGAAGAALGVGKGVLNMATKTASATLGIVAYPGQGIYKSIRTAVHSKTRRNIAAARQAEGEYLASNSNFEVQAVLHRFDTLCRISEEKKEKKGRKSDEPELMERQTY